MTAISPDDYAALIAWDVNAHDTTKPRALLTDQGHLGMSSLRCREQARRVLLQMAASDAPPKWAAIVGTAIDEQFEQALKAAHPEWLYKVTVRATLPSGFEIEGTCDWADPNEPSVTDLKSKAGLVLARKHWHTEHAYKMQRHLLYLGMIQNHGFPKEGIVRNVVVDRTGKDGHPFVWQEMFSMDVVRQADDWLADVMYAIKNNEEAPKDLEGAACAYCPFVTACRGTDVSAGPISTPYMRERVDRYGRVDAAAKKINALRDEMREEVIGTTGYTDNYVITTTQVATNGSRRVLVRPR